MGRAKDRTDARRMAKGDQFEIVFPGDQLALRRALKKAMQFLHGLSIPAEACGLVEIVLAEAVNNVIEHAYAGASHGVVEFRMQHLGGALRFVILDDGLPMPDGVAPAARIPKIDSPRGDLPEGGFGWHIIRELTRDLSYSRIGNRNRLEFWMYTKDIT